MSLLRIRLIVWIDSALEGRPMLEAFKGKSYIVQGGGGVYNKGAQ